MAKKQIYQMLKMCSAENYNYAGEVIFFSKISKLVWHHCSKTALNDSNWVARGLISIDVHKPVNYKIKNRKFCKHK